MKILVVVASAMMLTACSSPPKHSTGLEPQYCYTNQEIDLVDGKKVSSRTRVECTDDRTRQLFQARSGIAKDCIEFSFPVNRRGQLIEERGYACQKFSGTYEVFNPSVAR
jgi:hypothetical protein